MCGIVGAVADRDIVPILIEGLKRLEYRGYDSAGVAVLNGSAEVARLRAVGKVARLSEALVAAPTSGQLGIAHTRWATHGVPNERNAHPHISRDGVAIVHNGIIENHEELRSDLERLGYSFDSETDTEVIAHRIHHHLDGTLDLFGAVRKTVAELRGAYSLAVMWGKDPDCIVLARVGCPALIGIGKDENFVASDIAALLPVTRRFIVLEEGDVACIRRRSIEIVDADGRRVERLPYESEQSAEAAERGTYAHFMLKEIHEQPRAVAQTLEERVAGGRLLAQAFGPAALDVLKRTTSVHIVACGTSYHAGIVARYFIEQLCRVPCRVEIASEFRYRDPVVPANTLFVSISQSGETADTLAALRLARKAGFLSTLAICNVPESSLVRESGLVLLTRAGPEIGVASTKAFTTQLAALGMLVIAIGKHHGLPPERERTLVQRLIELPAMLEQTLALDPVIRELAQEIAPKHHALFLGRGAMFPIAVLLVPTLVTALWMGAFGGIAIEQAQAGVGELANGIGDVSLAMFQMFENMPLTMVMSSVAVLLVLVFFVTSADSGSLVIDSITSGGKTDAPMIQRLFWASLVGIIAAVLLVGGGAEALTALQAAAITTGLPFTLVLMLMCLSLYKGLKTEVY
jgi:glucosamine--fructose-6-phosphate aminotransferase (isomerizing)